MTTETHEPHDVVKLYTGPTVDVELRQQALREAGIESNVLGLSLTASFGSALNDSVELWVKSEDAERAATAIKRFEENTDDIVPE